MLKMGVPKEAVERQKLLDNKISKPVFNSIPPPPPPPGILPGKKINSIPKIKASDLSQIVVLKKVSLYRKKTY